MSRASIEIDDRLLRRAARATGMKATREIVRRALELLVKTEKRKSILTYFGSGIWKGDLRELRRNRV